MIIVFYKDHDWHPPQNIMTAIRLMGAKPMEPPLGLLNELVKLQYHNIPECYHIAGEEFPLPVEDFTGCVAFLGVWETDKVFTVSLDEPDFANAFQQNLAKASERIGVNANFGVSALRHDMMVGASSPHMGGIDRVSSFAEKASKDMARSIDASILENIKMAAEKSGLPKSRLKELFKGIFDRE
jgi:hypothetical protein